MLSIVKSGSWALSTQNRTLWKLLITQILNTGERAWRLALPFFETRIAGDDTVNAIINKFAVLDDALDHLLPEYGISGQRQRGSDELRDTQLALVAISQATGNSPYQPPPTAQQIDSAKSQIRQRRKGQAPDASAPSEPIADTPPTTLLPKSLAHNWNPTITAFVTISTMLAAIPGYKAWQNSAHAPGTVQDADFWILVQGSIMQLLAVLTIIFTLLISSTSLPARSQPWFWTWGFVMTSLICSVSAVPLYLRCPTEWSQTLSFLGSAAQAFDILQAMFTMEKSSSNAAKNR